MASKTKSKNEAAKSKNETRLGGSTRLPNRPKDGVGSPSDGSGGEENGAAAVRVDAGLQLKTLAGDVRDAMLEWLKNRPPGAFKDWPAAVQIETARQAQQAAEDLARGAMRAAAGHGFAAIPASLKSFAVKDGARVVLEAAASDEVVMALNHARGAEVVLVPVRAADFLGQRAPVAIAPDQGELLASAPGQQPGLASGLTGAEAQRDGA